MGSPHPPQMGTAWWPQSGHPTLELEPQISRQGREVAEKSGSLPGPWLCIDSSWEKHWFAACGPYPATRTGLDDPAVGSSWPLAHRSLREVGPRLGSSVNCGSPPPSLHLSPLPLPARLDLPFWVLILRWVLALAKAGACLPQAVLGNRMQAEVAPAGCSSPSHYMIHSG